ncbi:hypothetical protein BJ138DRAFT_1146451 [Hygrophoropsis aurantiaca]|uniref:Uncharacterized protein n=1 Tax=Hygrophoropsis aurantiaca TaxID=72124 RepID=A0ACB8AJ07_9AGAM|nr:hypothetical protein BJ138DRAFT_1146451 [Hygrophoropsis aurantiaca]
MVARILTILPFALVAVAQTGAQQACDANPNLIKCCDSVQQPHRVANVLKKIGLTEAVTNFSGVVGVECTGADTGHGRPDCYTKQMLCCPEGDLWNGLIIQQCEVYNSTASA